MKLSSVIVRTFILSLVLLLLNACTRMVTVELNSIVDPTLKQKEQYTYYLSPDANTSSDDLYFKEYSHYFTRVLKQRGYTRSRDKSKADIEIIFSYGLSDGSSGIYTYSTPVYEFTGGETITITESNTDPTLQPKVTTIYVPPRYERVGTDVESREYTYYIAHATLEAKSLTIPPGKSKPSTLWHIHVQSKVGSDDLRKVMPYLAHAASPYIGKNSGHQLTISIKENDPNVIDSETFKH